MMTQTVDIPLRLETITLDWLKQLVVSSGRSLPEVISDILNVFADPENQENELVDRLLKSAVVYFPAVMELDEQSEMQGEVIDYLCTRLLEVSASVHRTLTLNELAQFREKLLSRSTFVWST
ncbi:MAG: hypothetical protein U0930_15205 [Pirellulales bacterium]